MTTAKPALSGGSAAKQRLLNSFTVDYYSEVDGRRYQGKFVSKKLSIRDIAALGVRKSQLNGGMHYDHSHPGHGVDEQTDEFNNMIAHLEIAVQEAPLWWNLDEITDIGLIGTVYTEVVTFENTFLGRLRAGVDGHSGSSEGTGAPSQAAADTAAELSDLVGEEVPAALQP